MTELGGLNLRASKFEDGPSENKSMFPPGLEPGTFRVLGERDNHYTTETPDKIDHCSSCKSNIYHLYDALVWRYEYFLLTVWCSDSFPEGFLAGNPCPCLPGRLSLKINAVGWGFLGMETLRSA